MAGSTTDVHSFAGTWYPRDRSQVLDLLSTLVEKSAGRAGDYVRPGAVAVLVPHAALQYSGAVAASAYRHVAATDPVRIVLLGFSHRWPMRGIAIPDIREITTPLGAAPVDWQFAAALADSPTFGVVSREFACDHSVELQVPFLQMLVPRSTVVPLYVGRLTGDERRAAAETLRGHLDSRTVLIASSDLTHFGRSFGYLPFSVDERTPARLRLLDERILDAAGSLDSEFFLSELATTRSTTCGGEPIALLLEVLRTLPGEEIFQDTLDYDTSGAMVGSYEHSVSYGAAGYFRTSSFQADASTREHLRAAAHSALDRHFGRPSERTASGPEPDNRRQVQVSQTGRAFVSLYAGEALRGCVGYSQRSVPLESAIRRLAVDAACDDARFQSLRENERVDVEIHILTPLKRLSDVHRFRLGEHGAFLKVKDRTALLLPVVARRFGQDRSGFLEALARKAGLSEADNYGPYAQLSTFRAQSFGDRSEERL